MGVIYKITNKVNGKIYVGQTSVSLQARWREHRSEFAQRRYNFYLYSAMRKYGWDNFSIEALEEGVPDGLLDEREKEWISRLDSINSEKGYNCTTGGGRCVHGPSSKAKIKGRKWTEDSKAKRSAKLRGRKLSPERKEALRLTRVGAKMSEESKRKMIEGQKKFWTPERRVAWGEKMREVAAARKLHSPGKNYKLSESLLRRWREIRSDGRMEEFRAKTGKRSREWWQNPDNVKLVKEKIWNEEKREEARKKANEFFSSPEGIIARAKISEAGRKRYSNNVTVGVTNGR